MKSRESAVEDWESVEGRQGRPDLQVGRAEWARLHRRLPTNLFSLTHTSRTRTGLTDVLPFAVRHHVVTGVDRHAPPCPPEPVRYLVKAGEGTLGVAPPGPVVTTTA